MLALLPLLVLLLTACVWIGLIGPNGEPAHRRSVLMLAATIWGTWLAVSSEILSALDGLSRGGLLAAWLLAAGVLLGVPALRRAALPGLRAMLAEIKAVRAWGWFEKLLLGGLLLEALLLLAVAWAAPPNTNDAMQYHLARVMHWLQNGNLAHYPTAIERQLWQPPWAELTILHLVGLGGSDRWANLVQWGAFLGAWIGASGIAALLGAERRGQLLAAWACAVLPMGILQATSSQNDLATSFWLLGVLLLVAKAHCHQTKALPAGFAGLRWLEWAGLGAMVALGLYTKGTFAVFVLPALGWLLVLTLRSVFADRGRAAVLAGWRNLTGVILGGAVLVLLINGPHWARNWRTYQRPLGPADSQAALINQPIGAAALYSNLLRNSAQQLALPLPLITNGLERTVQKLHAWAGLDVEEDGFTHTAGSLGFAVRYSDKNEDLAGYPLHFLGTIAAFLAAVFAKRRNHALLTLALVLAAAFLAFSLTFRWQPWGNRLLLPLFAAGAGLMGEWLGRLKPPYRLAAVLLFLAGALPALLTNTARPVLALQRPPQEPFSVFTASRGYLQFVNAPEYYNPWISLAVEFKNRAPQCKDVGYSIGNGEPEYTLWTLLSPGGRERRLEYVDLVHPQGVDVAGIDYPSGEFAPCAILSSRIDYNEDVPGYSLAASHTGSSLYLRNDKK